MPWSYHLTDIVRLGWKNQNLTTQKENPQEEINQGSQIEEALIKHYYLLFSI